MNTKEEQQPYPITSFPMHLLCVPDADDVNQKKKNELLLLSKPQKKKHTKKNAGSDERWSIIYCRPVVTVSDTQNNN